MKFQYRNYRFVSNWRVYNMLWLDERGDFLDIMTENQISADSD